MIKRIGLLALATTLLALAVGAVPSSGYQSTDYELRVNEGAKRFYVPKRKLTVLAGTQKFTVVVPETAKGKHGVGVDGGPYRNINGVAVRPGRSTSLTISMPVGKYTIYDSYKNNRARGYYVKVTVVAKKSQIPVPGTRCRDVETPAFGLVTTYVKNFTCGEATILRDRMVAANPSQTSPVVVDGFKCVIEPFTPTGPTTTCASGDRLAVFVGDVWPVTD